MHGPSPALGLLLAASIAVGASGCDEPKKGGAAPTATATATATAPAAPEPPPKRTTMPSISVTSDGIYVAGARVNLGDPNGAEQLAKQVKDLPYDDKPVTVIADKKAKVPHVAATVAALGEAGATKVVIKTDGRDDLPKEIRVTPQNRVASPPGCSVTTMVMKDLSTAVWPLKGGLGKRQRKGLAGPDLSNTGETLGKDIATCDSTMAFFSGDESVAWEMAFNLAGTLVKSDAKKKIDTLVLLREVPVAGRAVTLGK